MDQISQLAYHNRHMAQVAAKYSRQLCKYLNKHSLHPVSGSQPKRNTVSNTKKNKMPWWEVDPFEMGPFGSLNRKKCHIFGSNKLMREEEKEFKITEYIYEEPL